MRESGVNRTRFKQHDPTSDGLIRCEVTDSSGDDGVTTAKWLRWKPVATPKPGEEPPAEEEEEEVETDPYEVTELELTLWAMKGQAYADGDRVYARFFEDSRRLEIVGGGGQRTYRFVLTEDIGTTEAGQASCTITNLAGDVTIKSDGIVIDGDGIFSTGTDTTVGQCVREGEDYYITQMDCPA